MVWPEFLSLPLLVGLLLAIVAVLAYLSCVERVRLQIDRQVIVSDKLPPGCRVRILHISDLHANGSIFGRWLLRRYASQIRRLEYDLVAHSGDLLDNYAGIGPAVSFLQEVAAGRPAFTVLGNHDYHHYSWLENIVNIHTIKRMGLAVHIPIVGYLGELEERAREAGVTTLNNERHLVQVGECRIWLAGIDDMMLGEPNINRALDGASAGLPVVLLSHNPDIYPWAALAGVVLTLSGHTHGGQIDLPGIGPLLTRCSIGRKMAVGLTRRGGAALHVSRGLGETLPLRLNCPHHATVIELRGPSPGRAIGTAQHDAVDASATLA